MGAIEREGKSIGSEGQTNAVLLVLVFSYDLWTIHKYIITVSIILQIHDLSECFLR